MLLQDQLRLKDELTKVKETLTEEKALNAKHHADLLSILSALTTKFSSPLPETALPPVPCLVLSLFNHLVHFLFSTLFELLVCAS